MSMSVGGSHIRVVGYLQNSGECGLVKYFRHSAKTEFRTDILCARSDTRNTKLKLDSFQT